MPRCPKCKEEIDHLDASIQTTAVYEYWGDDQLGKEVGCGEDDFTGFFCPKCWALLFVDGEDADAFLEG